MKRLRYEIGGIHYIVCNQWPLQSVVSDTPPLQRPDTRCTILHRGGDLYERRNRFIRHPSQSVEPASGRSLYVGRACPNLDYAITWLHIASFLSPICSQKERRGRHIRSERAHQARNSRCATSSRRRHDELPAWQRGG